MPGVIVLERVAARIQVAVVVKRVVGVGDDRVGRDETSRCGVGEQARVVKTTLVQ